MMGSWIRRGSSLLLVVPLLLQPAARAAAQEASVPQEYTIQQLRETLVDVAGLERQQQELGMDQVTVISGAIDLLKRQYEEQILPGLTSVVDDCFFAEEPLAHAGVWARDVQITGASEPLGPLAGQWSVVQDLMTTILRNCHNQIYQMCVLDDGDPNASDLAMLTRQLGLLDDDPIYQQHWFNCEYGWHGTLTITESMQGSTSDQAGQSGVSIGQTQRTLGSREFSIELPNKKEQAQGSANGHISDVTETVSSFASCRLLSSSEMNTVSNGTGASSLRKRSNADGLLTLIFAGPQEKGSMTTTLKGTVSGTNCGAQGPPIPSQEMLLPGPPWRGALADQLADPYSETISGSRTLTFLFNVLGELIPARPGEQGGTIRIPAIPGQSPAMEVQVLQPWLHPNVPPSDPDDSPTITMTVTWNLQFGTP